MAADCKGDARPVVSPACYAGAPWAARLGAKQSSVVAPTSSRTRRLEWVGRVTSEMSSEWLGSSTWIPRHAESSEIFLSSAKEPATGGPKTSVEITPRLNFRKRRRSFWDSPMTSPTETER